MSQHSYTERNSGSKKAPFGTSISELLSGRSPSNVSDGAAATPTRGEHQSSNTTISQMDHENHSSSYRSTSLTKGKPKLSVFEMPSLLQMHGTSPTMPFASAAQDSPTDIPHMIIEEPNPFFEQPLSNSPKMNSYFTQSIPHYQQQLPHRN